MLDPRRCDDKTVESAHWTEMSGGQNGLTWAGTGAPVLHALPAGPPDTSAPRVPDTIRCTYPGLTARLRPPSSVPGWIGERKTARWRRPVAVPGGLQRDRAHRDRGCARRGAVPGLHCPAILDPRHQGFRPPVPGRVAADRKRHPRGRRSRIPRSAQCGRADWLHPGGVPDLSRACRGRRAAFRHDHPVSDDAGAAGKPGRPAPPAGQPGGSTGGGRSAAGTGSCAGAAPAAAARAAQPGQSATFAEWMSSALRREGLTQEAAARQLGVSVKTVSRWVGGATEPRMRDLRRIQEVFGEVPLP